MLRTNFRNVNKKTSGRFLVYICICESMLINLGLVENKGNMIDLITQNQQVI